MNSLDFISILICLTFLGLGFSHGLIKSVSSLVAIIIGLYCAKRLEPFISKILGFIHINNPEGISGYIFVFFCIFISVKILLLVVQKVTKAAGLSPLDRALGGTLGLVKGIVITVIVCTILQIALPADSAILRNSKLLPYTNKIVSSAHVLLPSGVYRHIGHGKEAVRNTSKVLQLQKKDSNLPKGKK